MARNVYINFVHFFFLLTIFGNTLTVSLQTKCSGSTQESNDLLAKWQRFKLKVDDMCDYDCVLRIICTSPVFSFMYFTLGPWKETMFTVESTHFDEVSGKNHQ